MLADTVRPAAEEAGFGAMRTERGALPLVALAGIRLRREAEPPPDPFRRFRERGMKRRPLGHGNPVTWKEVRLLNTSSSRPLFYSVLGVLLLVLAISFGAMEDSDGMSVVLAVEIPLVAFVALGMPIGIALGVGALGAALLYPALNPIIIPTRFVGLLSDSFLLLAAPLFVRILSTPVIAFAADRAKDRRSILLLLGCGTLLSFFALWAASSFWTMLAAIVLLAVCWTTIMPLIETVADFLDVPVVRPMVAETVALGAAYAAGLGAGYWPDRRGLRRHRRRAAEWQPAMDPRLRAAELANWRRAVELAIAWGA